jgi:hypothetical protein
MRTSFMEGGTPLSDTEETARAASTPPTPREPWWRRLRRRAPFTWPRKRKRRWLIALVLLLLAYPVLGTLALWTGFAEWVLASEDLRVEIENPAYTLWPGRIRMKHVRILMNGTTQFILDGQDLVLDARVFALLRHRVHVTTLAAHDVIYQMRVQVKDPKGIEQRLAAYPPLPGLPGKNVIHQEKADASEKREGDWTVEVGGLDIAVKELWFFEYRYLGKGRLRGGFTVGPHVMQVTTAVQDLGPGEVRFGADQVVAENLRGQITADIPRLNPTEHADASFMQLVNARVNLRADVKTLSHADAYAPELRVRDGQGPLAVDAYLDRGKLGDKSHFDFSTDALRVLGDGFGVATDLTLKLDAAASKDHLPLARASAKATYVSLSRGMRSFTLQLLDHAEQAELDTIQLSRATELKHATLRLPQITSTDLRDLPVLLPEGTPVKVLAGELDASLNLDMDEKYWVRGPLTTSLRGLDLDLSGMRTRGNVTLKTNLRLNPKLKTNSAEAFSLAFRDVGMHANGRDLEGWWLDLTSSRMTFKNTEPSRFDGIIFIRARDLAPILQGLAQKDVISKLVPLFTKLGDFRAAAGIRMAGPVTDVAVTSESDVWDASGRVYKKGKDTKLAVVVGGQAVSLGIADLGNGLEIMPFAKTGWLNEHLRAFPKPLVQMSEGKP